MKKSRFKWTLICLLVFTTGLFGDIPSTGAAPGDITTVAGRGSGDGGPATSAGLSLPAGIFVDSAGDLYFADPGGNRVRKVDASGVITTVVGNGVSGFSGDGDPATEASLSFPVGVCGDGAGALYIADTGNHRIRKVDASGVISTVAGDGFLGLDLLGRYAGDGGPATRASLNFPAGVAVDRSGALYIADTGNHRIRKVDASGVITTVAGDGFVYITRSPANISPLVRILNGRHAGDGGPAKNASLNGPVGVAVDSAGNLYIGDWLNHRVRKVDALGVITTLAGDGTAGYWGDGGPATNASLNGPMGVAMDRAGNLHVAEWSGHRVRRVDRSGVITTLAGNGIPQFTGDGGPAALASLASPISVAVDSKGNLYISDQGNSRVRRVGPDGIITTVAGTTTRLEAVGDGGPATKAELSLPIGVAVDSKGNLYIADQGTSRIRKVGPDGIIATVVGTGTAGFSGDGGPATKAAINMVTGVAVDTRGNLYIADTDNHRIRRVGTDGIITTVAGTGRMGSSGDGGPATQASLNSPYDVAADAGGNLYIVDAGHRLRRVGPDGVITTLAGTGSTGFSGDGGPGNRAALNYPLGVAVDEKGGVYIADAFNHRIRRVSPDGVITTIAGSGPSSPDPGAFSGDGGPATQARLMSPLDVAVDAKGNVYIADASDRIRRVGTDGVIATIAGTGKKGFSGDGGPATLAAMNNPQSLTVDAAGNVYIADYDNNRVRRVSPAEVSTLSSDFDGNGRVDFDDFFLFAAAFGVKQGDAQFDPRFDLKKDGKVDFDDFFLFAADFGRTTK